MFINYLDIFVKFRYFRKNKINKNNNVIKCGFFETPICRSTQFNLHINSCFIIISKFYCFYISVNICIFQNVAITFCIYFCDCDHVTKGLKIKTKNFLILKIYTKCINTTILIILIILTIKISCYRMKTKIKFK